MAERDRALYIYWLSKSALEPTLRREGRKEKEGDIYRALDMYRALQAPKILGEGGESGAMFLHVLIQF